MVQLRYGSIALFGPACERHYRERRLYDSACNVLSLAEVVPSLTGEPFRGPSAEANLESVALQISF